MIIYPSKTNETYIIYIRLFINILFVKNNHNFTEGLLPLNIDCLDSRYSLNVYIGAG